MCMCVVPFIAQIQTPEKESESDLHPPLMLIVQFLLSYKFESIRQWGDTSHCTCSP